jgi:hypothetical protein
VLSWLSFSERTDSDLHGDLSWIKLPNMVARSYPAGFSSLSEALGSAYIRPVAPTDHVLNLDLATISFLDGNLSSDFSNSLALGLGSRVMNLSDNRLAMSFSAVSGSFRGTVTDPATGKALPFSGAVFQKLNTGHGLLLGPTQTSRVRLGP